MDGPSVLGRRDDRTMTCHPYRLRRICHVAALVCLMGVLPGRPAWAWDWYAGDLADYRAHQTSADIPERIQHAIDAGLDWLLLGGDERVGQYIGLHELLQEYELNAPRIVPVLSAGWRDTSEVSDRLVVFGVDPRAPIPSSGIDTLLLWAASHDGAVLFRAFPKSDPAALSRFEACFVGLRDGAWDPACDPGGEWDERLKAGPRLFVVGSSSTTATPGVRPTDRTYVWAERSEPTALIHGLRHGAAYVAQADVARLDLQVNGTGIGDTAPVMREAYVRIRAAARRPITRVAIVADGEVVWAAQPDTALWEERFFLPVQGRSYLRAVVQCGSPEVQSLSNPVFLAPEADVDQGEVPLAEPGRAHPEPIYLEIDGVLEVLSNLEPHRQVKVLGEMLRNVELRYETARVLEVRKDLVPDPVLWDLLHDDDADVRLGAACALVLRGPVELPELLVGLLDDGDPAVRAYAARMLQQYTEGLQVDDPLPLLTHADPLVRGYLIRAVSPTTRSDSLTVYLTEQCRARHPAVASAASDKLVAMGTRDFRVIQALLRAARQGNDRALSLVGLIGDRRTIPELERIFRSESAGPLKRASFLGLARMGAPYLGRKELACGWLTRPPAVDGLVDSTEWAEASLLSDFRGDDQAELVEDGTVRAWIGRDATHLYLAFSREAAAMAGDETAIRLRDEPGLSNDRRLEVAIALPGSRREPWVLSVTPLGVVADRRGTWEGWDPAWEAVSRREPGTWSVECAVPLGALGTLQADDLQLLRLNVSYVEGAGPADRWAWSVTYGGPEDPDRFGDLLVARPANEPGEVR